METHLVDVDLVGVSGRSLGPAATGKVPTEEDCFSRSRASVQSVVDHIGFRVAVMILIIIDFIFIIADLATDSSNVRNAFDVISMLFSSLFLAELCARIFSRG